MGCEFETPAARRAIRFHVSVFYTSGVRLPRIVAGAPQTINPRLAAMQGVWQSLANLESFLRLRCTYALRGLHEMIETMKCYYD
eukprot:2988625-Alexandrium_andersonii.AAC.1